MTHAVRNTGWFKSSRSAGASDQCIEVRIFVDNAVGIRDSKNTEAGALWVAPTAWTSFLTRTKTDTFDPPAAP